LALISMLGVVPLPHSPTCQLRPSHTIEPTFVPVFSALQSVSALGPVQLTPVGLDEPEMVIFEYVPVSFARNTSHEMHCDDDGPVVSPVVNDSDQVSPIEI
jgi:hypothetical protein